MLFCRSFILCRLDRLAAEICLNSHRQTENVTAGRSFSCGRRQNPARKPGVQPAQTDTLILIRSILAVDSAIP